MSETLADRMFAAHRQFALAEDAVTEVLATTAEACGSTWADFTVDDYDSSIEVYETPIEPTEPAAAMAAALHDAGFKLVWLHPHAAPRNLCKCRLW